MEQSYSTKIKNLEKNKEFIGQYLYEYIAQPAYIRKSLEYEIRFGKRKHRYITKSDFEDVIVRLKELGFSFQPNTHLLRISSNNHTIRTEIQSTHAIQQYCKSETITKFLSDEQKKTFVLFYDKKRMESYPVRDYSMFGFRVSLQEEKEIDTNDLQIQQIINTWDDTPKTFRLLNRLSAVHKDMPGIRIDLSVVKMNTMESITMKKSKVMDAKERYEIEIEYMNTYDNYNPQELYTKTISLLKKTITFVLQGLQQSLYPISYDEMDKVESSYLKIFQSKDADKNDKRTTRLYPSDFIGPSSVSLEQKHLLDYDANTTNIIITDNYTVTDKADGMRKLLYISNEGRMYFISTSMKFQFTGMKTENIKNVILDGEHITQNKYNQHINLYAVFDIYLVNATDIRDKPFMKASELADDSSNNISRFDILSALIKRMVVQLVDTNDKEPMRIETKNFYTSTDDVSIFKQIKYIMDMQQRKQFEYDTDGIIFTPAFKGVALNSDGTLPSKRVTWRESFKWKPPEFNTIDFLVKIVKENNIEKVKYTTLNSNQPNPYKTLVLHIGYDENNNEHGYINPCKDVLEDRIVTNHTKGGNYRPEPFQPTNPSDDEAMLCNILLRNEKMYTLDNSVILDNTIVECKYDMNAETGWRWVPIRVRHDKTSELQRGLKQYGNAYHVANSVWHSIHHPVTENMIQGKEKVIMEQNIERMYYNRGDLNHTQPLRSFHNLYVKNKLIGGTSPIGGTLLDLAVGKAGDLSKWKNAKLGFVLGVDISEDNIHNRRDGACTRYLKLKSQHSNIPKAIFLQAKSNERIKDGTACFTEKGKEVMKALYGIGPKDKQKLDKQVFAFYGVGRTGFNVVSCQFALHYFFQNKNILYGFIRNVVEGCSLNGYFIGTMYDGVSLFRELEQKSKGENVTAFYGTHKIWEVVKQYERTLFEADESSLGYAIDVYQESINQSLREYLVHFEYFKSVMYEHGFVLLEKSEANEIGLPSSTGLFHELFLQMKKEVQSEMKTYQKNSALYKLLKESMKLGDDEYESQKNISFLNRYFVFKKVREHSFQTLPNQQVQYMDIDNENEIIPNPDININITIPKNEIVSQQRFVKQDIFDIISNKQLNELQYERFVAALRQITMGCHSSFSDSSFIMFISKYMRETQSYPIGDYDLLQKYVEYTKSSGSIKISNDNLYERGSNRARIINEITTKGLQQKGTVDKLTSYLDYGCGDGEITRAISEKLKFANENVFYGDIKQYPSLVNVQFVKTEYGKPMNIPNNSIELITTQMVLHHIDEKHIDFALRDMYRMLKPGGLLVIREHDAPLNIIEKDSFSKIIDIVHDVYDYVIEAEMTWKEKDDYYSKYRPIKGNNGWDSLIERNGFKLTKYQKRIDRNVQTNPQSTCYRMYYKVVQYKYVPKQSK